MDILLTITIATSAALTVYVLGTWILVPDPLTVRLRQITSNEGPAGDRAGLPGLLESPDFKALQQRTVDRLRLDKWLATATGRNLLNQAGYRGPSAETSFLFSRLASPILAVVLAAFYLFVLDIGEFPILAKLAATVFACYAGMKLPEIVLRRQISRRQKSIRRTWPDALDLLLISVQGGSSIEESLRRIAHMIGVQSKPLAEELVLTIAELALIGDRRQAYENLGIRTGVKTVRTTMTVMIQAEAQGTSIGQALRALAEDGRAERISEATAKAKALPPKLTIPTMLIFLPALFVMAFGPFVIQYFQMP